MSPSSIDERGLPLVDLHRQYASLRPELQAAIDRVFSSSEFILGNEVASFEQEFAEFCGSPFAVACANGTDALELALSAVGVGRDDEVITVAHTFAATGEAIVRLGAVPRFADVDPDTLLMDVGLVESLVTSHTKAIVPVHLYGSCVDMGPLMTIARRLGLTVIEDAAQAHGALYGGERAGAIGDAGCFSFYPGKNLGAFGDAGAVVTRDPEVARLVRQLRDHGRSDKHEHSIVGRNSRMDALQAAFLRVKLPRLEQWNLRRSKLARRYRFLLEDLRFVRAVAPPLNGVPIYHLFVIEHPDRDRIRQQLSSAGISTGIHYPIPLHLQPAFAPWSEGPGSLPVTEAASRRILSLPMFPEMEDHEVDRVVTALGQPLSQGNF